MKLQIFIILSAIICFSSGGNILFLGTVPSPSHHNWNKNIYYTLAAKGHNITVLTPDFDKHQTKNVHFLKTDSVYEAIAAIEQSEEGFDYYNDDKKSKFVNIVQMWGFGQLSNELMFETEGFKALLNYPKDFKFDLVISDYTCGGSLLGFLDKFNYPPLVGVTAFSVPPYTYDYVSGHTQPSYVPHHMTDFGNRMTFTQRIQNYYASILEMLYFKYVFTPNTDALMKKYFNNPNLPHVAELSKKMSLALVNTHFAVEKVEPLPPNVIPVAGLQIREPKPLDPEIETFVKSSQKGTILFSLGTNIKSYLLTQELKDTFIKVFKDLPQYNFLWKYETKLDIPLTKNIKIQPWLKQNDILAHPNVKAFISHCGLLGTQEATWYGKPIIGMPFFADQNKNLNGILYAEAGVKIHHRNLTYDNLKAAIIEVMENPKYLKNAKKRGDLFRDQPDKPLDRAIYWLEWAMRHKADIHEIDSPAKDMSLFTKNGFDFVLCCLLIIVPSIHGVKFLIVKLIKRMIAKKSVKNKKNVDKKNK